MTGEAPPLGQIRTRSSSCCHLRGRFAPAYSVPRIEQGVVSMNRRELILAGLSGAFGASGPSARPPVAPGGVGHVRKDDAQPACKRVPDPRHDHGVERNLPPRRVDVCRAGSPPVSDEAPTIAKDPRRSSTRS